MTNLADLPMKVGAPQPGFAPQCPRLLNRLRSHILYAEDDTALRDFYSETLTRAGYRVTAVADGVCAWHALQSGLFDLLITDNEMPRLTGLDLITTVRLHGIELPIIMASGSADMLAGSTQRLRLAARLQKPVDRKDLLKTVAYVLEELPKRQFCHDFALIKEKECRHFTPHEIWGINE